MPRKRKTTGDRLTSWLRKPERKTRRPSKDAEELLADLQEEQARLSGELEHAFRAYDKHTRVLAKRLAKMVNEGTNIKELALIREEQEELWRVIRRCQAAERSNRELETELQEWAGRDEASVRASHPDHPRARAEIVASELRIRGRIPSVSNESESVSFEGSAKDVDPYRDAVLRMHAEPDLDLENVIDEPIPTEGEGAAHIALRDDALAGTLIDEIASCTCELKRALAHDEREALRAELMTMLKDLRRLHGQLRTCDRASGIRRYRLGIGDPTFE
jgi:hypothetical protein